MTQASGFGYRRVVLAMMAATTAVTGAAFPALAQNSPSLPSSVQPGRDRPPLTIPGQPQFDFRIETPGRSSVPRSVDEIRFRLNGLEIKGAVTLPAERFRPFYQALIGKEVSLSDILDVAAAIENEYRKAGYILVRAFVPPQRVADGIFSINVVEGFIANISLEGGSSGTRNRIRTYLEPAQASRPVQLAAIERAMLLANDLPGITAGGVLRPSPDTPGASELVVTVPDKPVTGRVAIDNRGSRYSGLWSATADVAVNAVFDDEDQLEGILIGALDDSPLRHGVGQLRYRRPVGDDGGELSVIGTITHGEPGSTLQSLDVLTDSWAAGPRFVFPWKRSRSESLLFEGGLTAQEAKVDILGTHLSHDSWRVADVGVSYARSDFLGAAWTANLDIAQGLPVLGASDNGSLELSRFGGRVDFTKLSGGFHATWLLPASFDLALTGQGQYALNPLLIGEQVAFGGTPIGRGYDPGALAGDHGLGGAIELRYDPLLRTPGLQAVEPYVFYDTAGVWNAQNIGVPSASIASVGGGVRAWFDYDIFGGIEVAHTLKAVPGSDNGRRATKVMLNLAMGF
ncbi:MAG TPA: ShlB/FhaC/HecB family hemolysin secretion/activation protein [Rhizomicrobium sp.]|nr:ShlB/FhaC/HecB family hemolysin secretion/activation protein [Rhizomicrobium sp.]